MAADGFSIENDGYSFSSPVNRLVDYYYSIYFLTRKVLEVTISK